MQQPTMEPMRQPGMDSMTEKMAMASSLAAAPAYGTMRAEDLPRARHFYNETLGMQVEDQPEAGLFIVNAGMGTRFAIYERPGMPAPMNTQLTFIVREVETTVRELQGRGVRFEDYDMPEIGLKTVNGVAMMGGQQSAWFKDTEGNILSIASM
jgi:catechol 2,3-dioxygenase-like lactoylglutathione lyase family enzyme